MASPRVNATRRSPSQPRATASALAASKNPSPSTRMLSAPSVLFLRLLPVAVRRVVVEIALRTPACFTTLNKTSRMAWKSRIRICSSMSWKS